MGILDRIQSSIYRSELLARFRDYSVSPKNPQPVQTAQAIEDLNQGAYRANVPTPDQIRKLETDATGLGLGGLDIEA